MVLAGLPVAVHPQTAEQSAHGADDKGKVREVVVPRIDFPAHFPKFRKAGLGGCVQGKKMAVRNTATKRIGRIMDLIRDGFGVLDNVVLYERYELL